jgi:hypothetical protein
MSLIIVDWSDCNMELFNSQLELGFEIHTSINSAISKRSLGSAWAFLKAIQI